MKELGPLPEKFYKKIRSVIPMVGVDLLIKTKDGLLLGVRKLPPGAGCKWPIGGRMLYGESLEAAVKRKAKEEVGIDVKIIRRVGVYSTVFTKKSGQKRHTVNVVYLVKMVGGRLKYNREYTKFLFVKRMDKSLPSYTAAIIRDSGVFGKVQGRPARSKDHFVI